MESTTTKLAPSLSQAYDTLNILATDTAGALQNALKAQLAILQLIQHPMLVRTCVDTLFQNLHHGIQTAQSEQETDLLRNQSALLVQSMLFIFHSTLLKKDKETRQEGIALMNIAAENITVYSGKFLEASIENKGNLKVAALQVAFEGVSAYFKNASADINVPADDAFHKRVANYITNLFDTEEEENQFLALLDDVFDKIDRNKKLLGTSIILSELVHNHSSSLIDYAIKDDRQKIEKKAQDMAKVKTNFFSGWYLLLYPLLFVMFLLTLATDWIFKTQYIDSLSMKLWFLFPIPIYVYKLIRNQMKKTAISKELIQMQANRDEKKAALEGKYSRIAAALNPYE